MKCYLYPAEYFNMPKDKERTQKSESVSDVLTASDIEPIVYKAMEAALVVLRDEIGKLITEMQSRVSDIKTVWSYLITFVITRITYCTISFLHLQQPHKTTIFDRELTANNYRNILDI